MEEGGLVRVGEGGRGRGVPRLRRRHGRGQAEAGDVGGEEGVGGAAGHWEGGVLAGLRIRELRSFFSLEAGRQWCGIVRTSAERRRSYTLGNHCRGYEGVCWSCGSWASSPSSAVVVMEGS